MSATRQSGYDERHGTPLEANRRGAHRARPNPVLALAPFVAVALVVFGVIGGGYLMFGDSALFGGNGTVGAATVPSASSPANTPQVTATSAATATATPSATAEATPSQTSAEPSATVDRDADLVVLNGTNTGGLGKRVVDKLEQDDWQVPAQATDFSPKPFAETTVFYAKKSERATAKAVAESLGSGYATQRDAEVAKDGITVVVGTDYQE
ncbi:MAG TPA: LytR C-terminal domain-containing protein [Actinomycetes bacterium]|nr:LytR C-terminal domain-containing protein [Actinomycetes bacterium]